CSYLHLRIVFFSPRSIDKCPLFLSVAAHLVFDEPSNAFVAGSAIFSSETSIISAFRATFSGGGVSSYSVALISIPQSKWTLAGFPRSNVLLIGTILSVVILLLEAFSFILVILAV